MNVITLDTLLAELQTALDLQATTLLGTGDIERAIPFNISAYTQDLSKDKSKPFSATAKVPALGVPITGSFAPSQNYQSYNNIVSLSFYGFNSEKDDLMKVLDQYALDTSGKYFKSDDWIYQLTFEKPTIIGRNTDEGTERVTVVFDIGYLFLYKGYVADDVTITINGEAVPVQTYTHNLTKSGSSKDKLGDLGKVKTKNTKGTIKKVISFVHINNTEINKVHEDIDSGDFLNRTYTLAYALGTDYSNSDTFVLTDGTINVSEGNFVTISATFLLSR